MCITYINSWHSVLFSSSSFSFLSFSSSSFSLSPPLPSLLFLLLFLFLLLLPLSSNDSDMDLDGDRGRQMLRVLIQLAMIKHAPLAASALRLLIQHFSQRKEMVNGFKQVRLSVCQLILYLLCIFTCSGNPVAMAIAKPYLYIDVCISSVLYLLLWQ